MRKSAAQGLYQQQKIFLPLSKQELQQIRACQDMIELESTRAKRYPVPTSSSDKSTTHSNFNPRSSTGWRQSDPMLVAKMYQKTKEELEKWLHVRAALLNMELQYDQNVLVYDTQSQQPISVRETNAQSALLSGRSAAAINDAPNSQHQP